MPSDKTVSRARTWRVSHTLYTSVKPDAACETTVGCVKQAQLIHGTLSKVCSMKCSSIVLQSSSTSIFKSPVRRLIVVSHESGLVLLVVLVLLAQSSIYGLHLGQIYRSPITFASMVGRHLDSHRFYTVFRSTIPKMIHGAFLCCSVCVFPYS